MSYGMPRWITAGTHRVSNATKPGWAPYLVAIVILLVLVWTLQS